MFHTVGPDDLSVHEFRPTPGQVEVVKFTGSSYGLELISLDGAAIVYFTTDGRPATIRGAHCRALPPFPGTVAITQNRPGPLTLSLISEGSPLLTVSLT